MEILQRRFNFMLKLLKPFRLNQKRARLKQPPVRLQRVDPLLPLNAPHRKIDRQALYREKRVIPAREQMLQDRFVRVAAHHLESRRACGAASFVDRRDRIQYAPAAEYPLYRVVAYEESVASVNEDRCFDSQLRASRFAWEKSRILGERNDTAERFSGSDMQPRPRPPLHDARIPAGNAQIDVNAVRKPAVIRQRNDLSARELRTPYAGKVERGALSRVGARNVFAMRVDAADARFDLFRPKNDRLALFETSAAQRSGDDGADAVQGENAVDRQRRDAVFFRLFFSGPHGGFFDEPF